MPCIRFSNYDAVNVIAEVSQPRLIWHKHECHTLFLCVITQNVTNGFDIPHSAMMLRKWHIVMNMYS